MAGSSWGRSSSPSRPPWEASSSGLGSLRSSGPAGPPPPSSGQRVPSLLGSPVREAILGRRKPPRSPDSIVAAPSAAMSDRSALNAIFPPPALWPTGPVVGHPIRPRRLHAPFHQEIKSGGEILLRADGRPASATRWPPLALPQIPVLSSWAAPAGPVRHCRESEDLRTAQGRGGPEGFRALAERPGARGRRCCLDQC